MLLNEFILLPKKLLNYSQLELVELAQKSRIDKDRFERIIEGKETPTFEDIDSIQEAMGLTDEMVADIMNSAKD